MKDKNTITGTHPKAKAKTEGAAVATDLKRTPMNYAALGKFTGEVIPRKGRGAAESSLATTLKSLKIGDAIFVPEVEAKINAKRSYICHTAKTNGVHVSCKLAQQDGKYGLAVTVVPAKVVPAAPASDETAKA